MPCKRYVRPCVLSHQLDQENLKAPFSSLRLTNLHVIIVCVNMIGRLKTR